MYDKFGLLSFCDVCSNFDRINFCVSDFRGFGIALALDLPPTFRMWCHMNWLSDMVTSFLFHKYYIN